MRKNTISSYYKRKLGIKKVRGSNLYFDKLTNQSLTARQVNFLVKNYKESVRQARIDTQINKREFKEFLKSSPNLTKMYLGEIPKTKKSFNKAFNRAFSHDELKRQPFVPGYRKNKQTGVTTLRTFKKESRSKFYYNEKGEKVKFKGIRAEVGVSGTMADELYKYNFLKTIKESSGLPDKVIEIIEKYVRKLGSGTLYNLSQVEGGFDLNIIYTKKGDTPILDVSNVMRTLNLIFNLSKDEEFQTAMNLVE